MLDENLVLFTGYAKLPATTPANTMYNILALALLVDMDSGTITDADCTLATRASRKFLRKALVGHNLNNGAEPLVRMIERIYQGGPQKAIMIALRNACEKYKNYDTAAY